MNADESNGHAPVLFDAELERLLVAAVLADPARLASLDFFAACDLVDFQAIAAFGAVRNVVANGDPLTPAAVRARLAADMLHKDPARKIIEHPQLGDLTWFDRIVATSVPSDPPVTSWACQILDLAIRRKALEAAEEAAVLDVDRDALSDVEPPARPRPPWWRAPELVDEILRYADEPWVAFRLGDEELVRIRAGGIAVIMGGSGSRKSSLTAALLVEHAQHVGPAIALSIELPAEEFGGRIVGMRCDASWEEALRGQVRREFMVDALDLPRLYVIDQENATLANLDKAIEQAGIDYPGQPILCAVDYAQLVESKEREVRMQVADAFKQINRITRRRRVVAIAVSQMSRVAAQQARDGEKIGAASADGGAESAAIERFATLTLSIGAMSEPRADGSQAVELSLGKARMLGGDRVFMMNSWGRSGRWRIAEAPLPATTIRERRVTERGEKKQKAAELAMLGAASQSALPLTREQLCDVFPGAIAMRRSAVACLIARGDLVEVHERRARSRTWLVWTPERAVAARIPLVRDVEEKL